MANIKPGARLFYWRRLRGHSRKAFATMVGSSVASICRKELGSQGLGADEVERYAEALGLTTAEFYGDIPVDDSVTAAAAE